MRTGTEFISEISAATIFTSFNFHIFQVSSFRFSGKGEVNVYRMCVCMCFILLSRSLVTVSGRLATRKFRHQPTHHQETTNQPTRHQETITPPTSSPPNKVVEMN